MILIDPCLVTCGRCNAESMQRLADFLGLRSTCPTCGAPLDGLGLQTRAICDSFGELCTRGTIEFELEEMLGEEISDAKLEHAHTLRDIACVIQCRLPPGFDQEARSISLVREAAKRVPWCSVVELDLDAQLMDAVDPGRWNRKTEVAE
jgi:hypothetical protein